MGDPDRAEVAQNLGVSVSTLAFYERGESEPTASGLAAYRSSYGVNVDWLLTGTGAKFIGEGVPVGDTSMSHVRKVVYNIAYSVAGKDLRRSKPKVFAEEFLDLFDYLMTLDERDESSAEKVVEFGAERLKRASDQGER